MQSVKIKLPFKVSTNAIYSGTHWTKRKKHKDIMLWSFLGYKSQLKPIEQADLIFDFTFKRNTLDCSNCSYLVKLIEDCLVHYKIIKDDSHKFIKSVTISSTKGDDDEVTLTIKEITK